MTLTRAPTILIVKQIEKAHIINAARFTVSATDGTQTKEQTMSTTYRVIAERVGTIASYGDKTEAEDIGRWFRDVHGLEVHVMDVMSSVQVASFPSNG